MDRNFNSSRFVYKAEVATREGGVDRNTTSSGVLCRVYRVATREGGVDRNALICWACSWTGSVATREGGVDRNHSRLPHS